MKKVNLYIAFTNKKIKLNEKRYAFYATNNFFLSLESV